MNKKEIIIVGGGVIGCALAYYLTKLKIKALVIEKNEIGIEASSRNGGGVRQSARDLREMPLARHAVQNLWPGLSDELGVDVEYERKGNLRLGKTEEHAKILERIVSQGRSAGLDLKLIDRQEVREICPYASEEVMVASYCPTDGHANPMRTTLAFYKRAREMGAEFVTGETVQSILLRKGKVGGIKTGAGTYESDQVLVAAGFASRFIANSVGIDVPMQKVLVEALVTGQQPPMFPQMIGTAGSDFYGHQTKHGSFVFGGMTGLEPFASEESRPMTRNITAPSICRAILGYFPVLDQADIIRTWSGFLDVTADHVPVLSKVDEIPGLFLACGFSGHGYGISPAVGQVMAELVIHDRPSLSLDAFRYDRFIPKK
ncbi:NAD(P)/FAD-dependent oxidoreductase [Desulfoscipio gibsoniae]|uniref:Glycine/D-amino acid oxidase, deaminating n=1 Tax=Desulfoscipio gibsoniae DSM 7213 TaxID=767817 RepID=R4KI44_9FIRM|nr:FAD-binding oxidoreductase [Desulfoscipio gibsoniae]AGL02284.1 glycine/D-amino acid oxidase, deaminating [Desulfoscipio gibsoniae DSM 7213]